MNWYKISEYVSSYGAWLSPDGELTPVSFSAEHEDVAQLIASGEGYKVDYREEYAGSVLRKQGYATLTFQGGMAIWYDVPLSDIQIKKLATLFKGRIGGTSYVRIISPEGNDFAKSTEELTSKLL